jgi:predicted glutamine amidotransferase
MDRGAPALGTAVAVDRDVTHEAPLRHRPNLRPSSGALSSRQVTTPRETPGHDGDDARPREACGVFGVYAPGQDASHIAFYGLFALQHRGQESAGIAASDGATVTVYKDMGLVAQVFDERALAPLEGHLAIGHTRYSTTGSTRWENAQPVHRQIGATSIALGHNGNLTNTAALSRSLGRHGSGTDSELMLEAIARRVDDGRSDARGLEVALAQVLPSFAFATRTGSAHCASDGSDRTDGSSPPRHRRSTSSEPPSSGTSNRERWW